MRAIAVALVVAYHGHLPIPGGYIGVDVFFVVSGFVITAMLHRQLSAGGVSFRQFYARRMRRLLPALAVLSTVTVVLSMYVLSPLGPQQSTARTAFAASIFLANIQLSLDGGGYFDLAAETNAMLHTWSLSVEEQFYFIFPALLVAAWRIGRNRGITASVGVVTASSFAYSCFATYQHAAGINAFYSPATRAWEFGAGSLVALSGPLLVRSSETLASIAGFAGLGLIGVGAFVLSGQTPFPGLAALLPVGGAVGVLAAGTVTERGVASLLCARPLTLIGDMSYSWYLWHWPPIVFVAAMWPQQIWLLGVVAVVTLLPAWLSYRFIENPIRVNNTIVGRQLVALVAACMAVPVAMSGVASGVNYLERKASAVAEIASKVRLHVSETRTECLDFTIDSIDRCSWRVVNPRGTIYLVGDSNSAQFAEPLIAAANGLGYDVIVAARPSCPFVDAVVAGIHIENVDRCHDYVAQLMATLPDRRPDLVIVANSSSEYIENQGVTVTDPATRQDATTADRKAVLWESGFERALRGLGQRTIVIHPVPHFGQWPWDWQPEACPLPRMINHSCPVGRIDRRDVAIQQGRAKAVENGVARRVHGVSTVDFTDDICTDLGCATDRFLPWLYRDATHLSVDGALRRTDYFKGLIAATAGG